MSTLVKNGCPDPEGVGQYGPSNSRVPVHIYMYILSIPVHIQCGAGAETFAKNKIEERLQVPNIGGPFQVHSVLHT